MMLPMAMTLMMPLMVIGTPLPQLLLPSEWRNLHQTLLVTTGFLQDLAWWRNVIFLVLGVMMTREAWTLYRNVRRKRFPPIASIPYVVPNPHWLFGILRELQRGEDWLQNQRHIFYQHAGGNKAYMSSFWMWHRPAFSVLHADAVNHILRRCHDRNPLPVMRYHYSKLLGKTTLVFARGKEWRDKRRMVHVAFVDQALHHAQQTILQMSCRIERAMVNTLLQQQTQNGDNEENENGVWRVEAYSLCKMATLDVFGMTALGYDFGCSNSGVMSSEHSPVFWQTEFLQREMTRRAFEQRWNVFAQCYWIPTPLNIQHYCVLRSYRNLLLNIVKSRRQETITKQQEQQSTKDNKEASNSTHHHVPSNTPSKAPTPIPVSLKTNSSTTINDDGGNNNYDNNNHTLLDYLLSRQENVERRGFGMSDEDLSDFLISVVFGGYDTTALTLSYTLYLLAIHPEYQNHCAKEAANVLGDSFGYNKTSIDSFLAITDLPFCYAAFLEAVRYYPAVAMSSRDLNKPISLEVNVDSETGKRTVIEIPTGVRFLLSFYWINHSECNFPRPDDYLPERWVQKDNQGHWQLRTAENDRGDGPVPRGKEQHLLTFSAGARSCVGRPLAMRLVTTLLAVMVRSFHIELADPEYKIELMRFGLNQIAKGGIPLKLRRRETPCS